MLKSIESYYDVFNNYMENQRLSFNIGTASLAHTLRSYRTIYANFVNLTGGLMFFDHITIEEYKESFERATEYYTELVNETYRKNNC